MHEVQNAHDPSTESEFFILKIRFYIFSLFTVHSCPTASASQDPSEMVTITPTILLHLAKLSISLGSTG